MTKHERIFFGTVFGAVGYLEPYEAGGLTCGMFSDSHGRALYTAIGQILDKGAKPDSMLIIDYAPEVPMDIIADINGQGSRAAVWNAVDKIKLDYKVRTYKRIGILTESMTAECLDDVAAKVTEILDGLDGHETAGDMVNLKDAYPGYIDAIEKRVKLKGEIDGVSTGIDLLDSIIYGFERRKLYCIGGRPSEGKSTILMNMAWSAALEKKPVGFISVESGRAELLSRIANHHARIPNGKINVGALSEKDFVNLVELGETVHGIVFPVYDKPNATIDEVKSAARHMVRKFDVQAVYIDYLQLIKVKGIDKRMEQVAEVSMQLKQLARMIDRPVIVAAQLSRDTEGRRPNLSDMQWSSQIEQDADCALMIWNNKTIDDNGEMDDYYLMIEKNRDGAKGWIRMSFDKEFCTFKAAMQQLAPQYKKRENRKWGK
jgi:replicative DNA helicase